MIWLCLDDLLQAGKGATTDEQYLTRIHLQKLLLGMLAPALRRYRSNRTLDQFEQGLLHPLS